MAIVFNHVNEHENQLTGYEKINTLEETKRKIVIETILKCDGNISKSSKALGISRATLYRLIRKYQSSKIKKREIENA